MNRKRISLRGRAEEIYNGRAKLGKGQKVDLPFVWLWLDDVATGRVRLNPNPKATPTSYRAKIDGGRIVYIAIGRPAPDDRDEKFDLYVVDICWPNELN